MSEKEEPRYEAIELIVRSRDDGVSWFDFLFDLITENCDGGETSDECSCGLASMGGSGGTLDKCYEWSQNVAAGISPIMIARTIKHLHEGIDGIEPDGYVEVLDWADREIEFEEKWESWKTEDAEEED